MKKSGDFLAELKRRNVIRMAVLYLVCAWVLVQVAETVLPIFLTPGWVLRALVVLVAVIALFAADRFWLGGDAAPAAGAPGKRTIFVAGTLVTLGIGLDAGWFLRPITTPGTPTNDPPPRALRRASSVAETVD